MNSLLVMVVTFVLHLAYNLYGKRLGSRYSHWLREHHTAEKHNDGVDYVPTNKFILAGHHSSSIAGTGPIVGPMPGNMGLVLHCCGWSSDQFCRCGTTSELLSCQCAMMANPSAISQGQS